MAVVVRATMWDGSCGAGDNGRRVVVRLTVM
jgi:hypothetical protein